METVQQNGRFTLFSSKFLSIHSILYACLLPWLCLSMLLESFVRIKIEIESRLHCVDVYGDD